MEYSIHVVRHSITGCFCCRFSQEEEAEQLLAPEDYAAEEERLRQGREKTQTEADQVRVCCRGHLLN